MPTLVRRTCLRMLLAGVCGVAAPLSIDAAQRQSATLEGTVQDSSGAVVGNAAVTVREAETGLTRTTRAGSAGSFRFTDLPIGTYEVRSKSPGFAPYVHAGVTLVIGQTARLLVVLQPPQVVEQVAVSAQPAALDSRQTSIASVVDTERIEESPVRSRNYLEFVLITPGVTRATPSPLSGAAAAMVAVWRASAFLQDHWTPVSTLTLDGGVRFDTTQFPSSVGILNRQFSPRAGAAWTAASNWVIRGGAGWFADAIVLASVERALATQQLGVVEQITDGSETRPSLYTVRPGPWNPASLQARIGAERLLTPNLTAAVTYLYASGRDTVADLRKTHRSDCRSPDSVLN